MKHKRLLLLFGILLIASLALAACGGAPAEEEEAPPPVEEEEVAEEEPVEEEPMEEEVVECVAESDTTKVEVCPGEKIRFGGAAGLTGPLPGPGEDNSNGMKLAVIDINEAGGILGFEVEVDVQDDACDGDTGTNVANLFAADPTIVAVSGMMCSGPTLSGIPIFTEARIPFMTPSGTNPAITAADCDICNRLVLTDAQQAAFDADYVYNTLGITKAAVMHDNSDYGLGLAELFQAEFEALGGEVTALEGIQVGDTDFRAVLTEVAADAPEMVFFGGYETEAGLIAAQMKETGLADAAFLSDDGAYTQGFLEAAGAAAEGQYISFPSGDEVADANADFDARYEAEFGNVPDDLGPFHANSYDTIFVFKNAIEQVGAVGDDGKLTIDREAFIAAVRGTSNLQGLTGTITCDAIGECAAGGIQIYQVQDGEFVQVSGFGLE